LVSQWTQTLVTGSAEVFPVLVLVARTLSPGLRLAMEKAMPLASRTFVPGVKLAPPQTAAASARVVSSAAKRSRRFSS
jgi:hypothetical protein